ncbi:hypothetical protein BGZ59_001483 [Podila verticillata]|nr:hypothetical protein BGZ59_001483 [Podila verticillata]
MFRGQRDHPYQASQGLATVQQGSGAKGAHDHISFTSSINNNRTHPFTLSPKQPAQRHIDGYFVSTAEKSSPHQRTLNSNDTLSEYFAQNNDTTFPDTKGLSTSYNDINDGFEDLDVQMIEMDDDDNGDNFVKQTEKLQLQTVPNISSAMNTLASTGQITPQHQGGWIRGARVNGNLGSGGYQQRVPVMNTQRGTIIPSSVRGPSRVNDTGGGERDKDPTKAVSGGIRLRSIHYATSVQALDGSISMDPQARVDDEHRATVVLVEVIGTLCTPMVYSDFCWNFSVRDPTRQDYVDKHPLSPPPSMTAPLVSMTAARDGGQASVSCRLFDMGNTLNLEILEHGELVRAIGVVSSTTTTKCDDVEKRMLLCVACRRATADETRLAIEGSTRCPPPKPE